MTDSTPKPDADRQDRPQNREVEDEMICPPTTRDDPPRPATEPKTAAPKTAAFS
jgi:hypothetical protein